MTKCLLRFVAGLSIIAMLIGLNGLPSASAHDFPPRRSASPSQVDDCMGARSCSLNLLTEMTGCRADRMELATRAFNAVTPAKAFDIDRRPALQLPTPNSSMALAVASIRLTQVAFRQVAWEPALAHSLRWAGQAWSHTFEALDDSSNDSCEADFRHVQRVAARPDAGSPPWPATIVNVKHNSPTGSDTRLVAVLPDAGSPPWPASQLDQNVNSFKSTAEDSTLPGALTIRVVEEYLPYDLCDRDWRFEQFSYRGLSRIAHLDLQRAEVFSADCFEIFASPSASQLNQARLTLERAAAKLEEWQCVAADELWNARFARKFGQSLGANWISVRSRIADGIIGLAVAAAPDQPQPALREPYFTRPLFVIYERQGKSFLLPVDRPVAWLNPNQSPGPLSEVVSVDAFDSAEFLGELPADSQEKWSLLVDSLRQQAERLQRHFPAIVKLLDLWSRDSIAKGDSNEVR